MAGQATIMAARPVVAGQATTTAAVTVVADT
jgi:hypothetical protein